VPGGRVTVGIGLVGLGYWGPNLARSLDNVRDGQLRVLCDLDPARLERVGARHPGAVRTTSYAALLDDPNVDAVVLATPVHTHFELAREALEAGKHLLVEKPLARTSRECEELVALAEQRGVTLMAGHVFLYNPAVRWVRDFIQSGELGEVYYVYSQRLNLGQVRQDVNALWNFGPHDISILGHWLGGPASSVVSRGFSYIQPGIEDVVFLTLDFPGGVGANVHISWLDPRKVRTMTVVGSRKMVVYDDVSADSRITIYDKGVTRRLADGREQASLGRYESFGEFQLLLRAGDVLIPKVEFEEPLLAECQHFVDRIRDGGRPLSDGQQALEVVRTLEAAQRSLELGGVPQSVEIPELPSGPSPSPG
jgi:predicted dehydrogenase